MREVSGRLFASLWDLVTATNKPLDDVLAGLPLRPDEAHARWDYSAVAEFLERALRAMGDEAAFVDVFRGVGSVSPDLVAVVPALPSLYESVRFVWSTVMPSNLTCLDSEWIHEDEDRYTIRYSLHEHYKPSRALMLAIEGMHRGVPRIAWRGDASVQRVGTPAAFELRVQLPGIGAPLPPTVSSGAAAEERRAAHFLGAMLADRAHLRRDALRLGRALRRVGAAAYEPTDAVVFAELTVRVLVDELACSFAAISSPAARPHEPSPAAVIASAGRRSGPVLRAPLVAEMGGERAMVGEIELCAPHGLETFAPLLTLVAVALSRRVDHDLAPSRAGQFPAEWRLTKRQRDVAELVAEGASNPTIAQRLGCGVANIEEHLTAIYAKACVDGRQPLAAAILAYRRSL